MGSEPLVFVFMGPPGAGKGTQGELLSARTGVQHISTGDLFRNAVRAQTPAGMRAEAYLESGELVPDAVVMQLVEEFLTTRKIDAHLGFDGFPRTRRQAEAFDALLDELEMRVAAAILIDVSDDVSLARLHARGRSDDTPETARHRLRVYHQLTEPLAAYYEGRGVLQAIDGSGDVEAVAAAVRRAYEVAM